MLKRERSTEMAQDYVESISTFVTRLNDYDEPALLIHDPQVLESMETCMCQIQYLIQHSQDNHSWLAAMSEQKLVELFVKLLINSFEFITTALEDLNKDQLTKKKQQKIRNQGISYFHFNKFQ